jgi:hypothetical protein
MTTAYIQSVRANSQIGRRTVLFPFQPTNCVRRLRHGKDNLNAHGYLRIPITYESLGTSWAIPTILATGPPFILAPAPVFDA